MNNDELKTWPEHIYLQDGDASTPGDYPGSEGVTWCEQDIGDYDVRYIRADLVAAPEVEQSPQAPKGWREFLVRLTETEGGMINGNRLSRAAKELLAAQEVEQAPVINFSANDIVFHAARIRRMAKAVGAEGVLPSDDRTIVGCVGTVMGAIIAHMDQVKRETPAVDTAALIDLLRKTVAPLRDLANEAPAYVNALEMADLASSIEAAIAQAQPAERT